MNRAYSIFLAISITLASAPLTAQDFETATHSFLRQEFRAADEALGLAREAVRIDEGLFTRSQTPLLIMQAENFSNSNDWAQARKLQDNLIWLFQDKFATPDQFMIDELRTMSRLHMHGVERDADAYRAYHYIRALYNNRLAMRVADAFWPSNDERKAELIHDHLQILHARASQAMDKSLLFGDSPVEAPSVGGFVLNLSEKLTLGDIRKSGIRYLARMRQLFDGDSGNAPEKLGIVNLYEADWLSLFDRNAEAAEIHDLSRSLFEQAGISEQVIDRLMGQPMLQPGMEYHASAERILRARSSRTSGGMTNAVSFSSMNLHPFADLFQSSPPKYTSSASAAP